MSFQRMTEMKKEKKKFVNKSDSEMKYFLRFKKVRAISGLGAVLFSMYTSVYSLQYDHFNLPYESTLTGLIEEVTLNAH